MSKTPTRDMFHEMETDHLEGARAIMMLEACYHKPSDEYFAVAADIADTISDVLDSRDN